MDPKERAIRDLYDARARRDWDAVATLFADEITWHEPGEDDHSGDYRGPGDVVALFRKLVDVTEGTFQLVPEGFLNAEDHSAVLVRWSAERRGLRSQGNDVAAYRFRDGLIAGVWFHTDGYEQEAFSAVFGYD
jgi:ketosteroid isomerase-like protein